MPGGAPVCGMVGTAKLCLRGSISFSCYQCACCDVLLVQVSVSKEHITIVGDGSTQADVEARVKQIKNLVAEVWLLLAVFVAA